MNDAVELLDRMLTPAQQVAILSVRGNGGMDGRVNTLEALERRGYCQFQALRSGEDWVAFYVLTEKGREARRALLRQREQGLR